MDELERHILQLLYEGYDDARVGRELGMAHRTVQRRVRSLMVRLDANGRFALGARAQELGWIDRHEAPPGPGRSAGDTSGNTVADAA
ncbi:LuxR C-terminal-related transcriptional regulator [Streptomyces sp. enrichment culture]|uniref:LuxR C-terminal-related transcriptional regulator n=1 Tax=Streptomyces sp. enrichment culture TaxID=1795815 RepID=UPI003F572CBC